MDVLQQAWANIDWASLLRGAVAILVIVAVSLVALRYTQRLVDRGVATVMARPDIENTGSPRDATEELKRQHTLQSLGGSVLRACILTVAFLCVLGVLGIDLGPAIAGLGLLSLGIGLGLQGLVKDVVAGTFILVENQFARGDVVSIAGVTGTVEDLGLRRTVLRDADGTVHIVPNGLIEVASNQTRIWARILVDIPVRDPAKVEMASAVVAEVGDALAADHEWHDRFLEAPRVTGVRSLAAAGVTLTAGANVVASARGPAAAELRRRVVDAFALRGIELGDAAPAAAR